MEGVAVDGAEIDVHEQPPHVGRHLERRERDEQHEQVRVLLALEAELLRAVAVKVEADEADGHDELTEHAAQHEPARRPPHAPQQRIEEHNEQTAHQGGDAAEEQRQVDQIVHRGPKREQLLSRRLGDVRGRSFH